MSDSSGPAGPAFSSFTPRRLLLAGTGAISVAFLPYWVKWVRLALPDVECRVVVTRSAERFVTRAALSAVSSEMALLDAWPDEPRTNALHVEWAEWAEAVAVYPATVNFISRFAAGMGDTPAMLALQCTKATIGFAPSLPPGAVDNPLLTRHLKEIQERPEVCVAHPEPGPSGTTGRNDAYVPPDLPTLLALMERIARRRAEARTGTTSDR